VTADVRRDRRAAYDSDPIPGPADRTFEPASADHSTATQSSCRPMATPNTVGVVEPAVVEQADVEQAELGQSGLGQPRRGQLERLQQVLAQRRAHRLQLERDGEALEVLGRAIALVRRGRDAGTSGTLRGERALFEQLLGDVDELVSLLARVSVRLGVLGLPADAPQLRAGLTAGEAGLAALVELAAALNKADPSSPTGPPPDIDGTVAASAADSTLAGSAAVPIAPVPAAPSGPAAGSDVEGGR
jgi:hypothetical protein